MKKLPVFQDLGEDQVFYRCFLLLIQDRSVGLLDKVRQVDIHRAHRFTGLAVDTVLYDRPVVFLPVIK